MRKCGQHRSVPGDARCDEIESIWSQLLMKWFDSRCVGTNHEDFMKEIISGSRTSIWSGYMLLMNTQRNDPGSDIVIKIAYTEVVESNLPNLLEKRRAVSCHGRISLKLMVP